MKKIIVATVVFLIGSMVAFNMSATAQTTPQDGRKAVMQNDLPSNVRTTLDGNDYDGWEFKEAYHYMGSPTRDGGIEYYHIQLKRGMDVKDVYLDKNGKTYDPEMKSNKDNMRKAK